MEQHIQSFIRAQEWQSEPVIEIHKFLCSSRERSVDFSESGITSLPKLRVAHRLQEFIDLVFFVLGVGSDLQTIYLLENLRFLVEKLLES